MITLHSVNLATLASVYIETQCLGEDNHLQFMQPQWHLEQRKRPQKYLMI